MIELQGESTARDLVSLAAALRAQNKLDEAVAAGRKAIMDLELCLIGIVQVIPTSRNGWGF